MPRTDNCLFLTNRIECTNPQSLAHFFCQEHKLVFGSLDNPTLLEETARSMRAMTYVSEDKKITAKADPHLIDAFINRLHEVLSRGYTSEEALNAIGDVIQEKRILDDQIKAIGKDPKWRKFEKIVAGIHLLQAQGAEVKFNDHILGKKTNSQRQIDVSIRFRNSFYEYLTIIECKDEGRKVQVDEIEAFSKKMEDVGARHGVVVSAKGFQKGAIGTATYDNIELFTLTEIKTDWTKKLKENVFTLPFPEHIELDHPTFEGTPKQNESIPIKYGQIVFYKTPQEPPILLTEIIKDLANRIIKHDLAMPIRIKVTFDPYVLYQFPKTTMFVPIYAVIIKFVPTELAFRYSIDIPPKLHTYRYADIKNENIHDFKPKDIPRVD